MRPRRLPLIAIALTVIGGRCLAREPDGLPLRFGLFAGWQATSDDYDVLGERRAGLVPGSGPMFGLRVGWHFAGPFALELESGMVVAPVAGESAWLAPTRLSFMWRALEGIVTPVAGLGVGFVAHAAGPGGGDLDLLFGATGGVEVRVAERIALRLEGGVLATDGVEAALSWSPIATLGIDLLAFGARRRSVERPETYPRPASPGCPPGVPDERCLDTDGDRRIDAFDQCPIDAGTRSDGCPDPDGDGVVGDKDACPRDRGTLGTWGCPR